MAVLFLLCAVVQLNDPDGWLWVAIYSLTLCVCVGWERGRFSAHLAMVVAVSAAAGAVWLWSAGLGDDGAVLGAAQWRMVNLKSERLREAGGLCLVSGWTAVLLGVDRVSGSR